jgi:hypothetical protein
MVHLTGWLCAGAASLAVCGAGAAGFGGPKLSQPSCRRRERVVLAHLIMGQAQFISRRVVGEAGRDIDSFWNPEVVFRGSRMQLLESVTSSV